MNTHVSSSLTRSCRFALTQPPCSNRLKPVSRVQIQLLPLDNLLHSRAHADIQVLLVSALDGFSGSGAAHLKRFRRHRDLLQTACKLLHLRLMQELAFFTGGVVQRLLRRAREPQDLRVGLEERLDGSFNAFGVVFGVKEAQ